MIFRHEYIQLIYLRENGFDDLKYNKKGHNYLPPISANNCVDCGKLLYGDECILCGNELMSRAKSMVGI